jgi:Icc-related predicted phosphoesterase
MRILAISDIHGNRTKLREVLAAAGPADVIVLAGDLTHLGSPDEAQAAVSLCRSHTPLVLTVSGNCDDVLIEKQMVRDGNSLTGTGRTIDGVGFFGVSAAAPYHGNTWEVGEDVLGSWAAAGYRAVARASHHVLVSHPPPYGFVDWAYTKKHGGSQAIRAALDSYTPALVICGHIHEARGTTQYRSTTIVNCGAAWMGYYALIDLGDTVTVELRQLAGRSLLNWV